MILRELVWIFMLAVYAKILTVGALTNMWRQALSSPFYMRAKLPIKLVHCVSEKYITHEP